MNDKPLLVQRMAWYQTCGNHVWWRNEMETFSALLVFRAEKFTGHRWIPRTKASDAEPWCFLLSTPEPTVEQRTETPVIKDAIALIMTSSILYRYITKNISYLLWNRGAWRFFHYTYLTIEVQGIRCTNHLHDSFPLTDVNPHFTAPGCRYYLKINSSWPIVTSSTHGPAASFCDVTIAHCSHGYLWTHDVEVGAS